jgi:hypothetical protein
MAEGIDLVEYERTMQRLALEFQEALKASLAQPYPFAPGFNKQRQPFGVRNMKTKTGALYNSIEVVFIPSQNEIQVSMLDYWRYVNDGRRPGKYVPIAPLMRWIRAKGFNKNKKTGRFEKFKIKDVAFAISTNIKKFGIEPTYFYDNAATIFERSFEDEAVRALGIDFESFFERVFEINK